MERATFSVYLFAKWIVFSPKIFRNNPQTSLLNFEKRGHLNVGYIDESYLQCSNESECALKVADTRALFTDVGLLLVKKNLSQPLHSLLHFWVSFWIPD